MNETVSFTLVVISANEAVAVSLGFIAVSVKFSNIPTGSVHVVVGVACFIEIVIIGVIAVCTGDIVGVIVVCADDTVVAILVCTDGIVIVD